MGNAVNTVKDIASKVWDGAKSVASKVGDGIRWVADKAGSVINGVKSGIQYAKNLPIIGGVASELMNTPYGQAFQTGLDRASGVVNTANTILNPRPYDTNVD